MRFLQGKSVLFLRWWCLQEYSLARFVLAAFDASVWPSNALYVSKCLEVFAASLSMSPTSMGIVMLPVLHAATSSTALVKHTRAITDFLMKASLDVTQQITISYDKQGSMANDKRKSFQSAMLVTSTSGQESNPWTSSKVFKSGLVGPIPLIKIADMRGYDVDADSRPGAAARVEQSLC